MLFIDLPTKRFINVFIVHILLEEKARQHNIDVLHTFPRRNDWYIGKNSGRKPLFKEGEKIANTSNSRHILMHHSHYRRTSIRVFCFFTMCMKLFSLSFSLNQSWKKNGKYLWCRYIFFSLTDLDSFFVRYFSNEWEHSASSAKESCILYGWLRWYHIIRPPYFVYFVCNRKLVQFHN